MLRVFTFQPAVIVVGCLENEFSGQGFIDPGHYGDIYGGCGEWDSYFVWHGAARRCGDPNSDFNIRYFWGYGDGNCGNGWGDSGCYGVSPGVSGYVALPQIKDDVQYVIEGLRR